MKSFSLGPNDDRVNIRIRDEDDDHSPIDMLINAAAGAPLPGKLGLIQSLMGIWSKKRQGHPALFYGKNLLNSAGAVRKYQKSREKPATYVDPMSEFIEENNLKIPNSLKNMGGLILAYSEDIPFETIPLAYAQGDSSYVTQTVRKYNIPGTEVYYYYHFYGSSKGARESDEYTSGKGPYLVKGIEKEFFDNFSEEIWKAERYNDLQLSSKKTDKYYGSSRQPTFALQNIGEPDDYVSADSSFTWKSVEKLGERCRAFQKKGMSRRIIFYGPPGTGKTSLARNLAQEVGGGHTLRIEASAFEETGSQVVTDFINLLRPRVILFDDLDRSEDSAEDLLHYMERAQDPNVGTDHQYSWANGVVVVATVNSLGSIDPALLRPGRFDEVVKISEPDEDHRIEICRHYLEKHDLGSVDPAKMAELTDGFSCADIREVVQCIATVGAEHLVAELQRIGLQRGLYAGDACDNFLNKNSNDSFIKDVLKSSVFGGEIPKGVAAAAEEAMKSDAAFEKLANEVMGEVRVKLKPRSVGVTSNDGATWEIVESGDSCAPE